MCGCGGNPGSDLKGATASAGDCGGTVHPSSGDRREEALENERWQMLELNDGGGRAGRRGRGQRGLSLERKKK